MTAILNKEIVNRESSVVNREGSFPSTLNWRAVAVHDSRLTIHRFQNFPVFRNRSTNRTVFLENSMPKWEAWTMA